MKKLIFFGLIAICSLIYPHQKFEELSDDMQALLTYKAAKSHYGQIHDQISPELIMRNDSSITVTWTEPQIINDKNPIDILKFTSNIIYNPGKNYHYPSYYQSYAAAIIIDKSNVTIDLAGFNLSLDGRSASSFLTNNPTFGIAITAGTKNVRIISSGSTTSQGSISGFTGYAIYALGSTQIMNSYDIYQNYIQNIQINNILLTSNASGIYLSDVLQAVISNTNAVYNFSSRPCYGIYCSNVLQSSIQNSNFNQNWSWSTIIGMYLEDTINCSIIKCQASYNRSLKHGNAIGIQLTGTSPSTSLVNTISECIANTNLSSYTLGAESIGYYINGRSHTNIIKNSQTFYNSHGPSFGGIPPLIEPKGYGIKLEHSNNNQITQNQSGYHSHYGFFDVSLLSSSFFISNISIFNSIANYVIDIASDTGSEPLPVVKIYQNDLSVYNYTTPLYENLSILPGSA